MGLTVTDNDNVIYINGPLSFATAPMLNKNNRDLIKQNPNIIFDLSRVTFSDNAGVALLVTLTSYAKNLGRGISFINSPEQLLKLIESSGVRDFLPII